jgi:hypothetical protein
MEIATTVLASATLSMLEMIARKVHRNLGKKGFLNFFGRRDKKIDLLQSIVEFPEKRVFYFFRKKSFLNFLESETKN